MPSITDKLFANGRELKLANRVGKGGEGEVFSLTDVPGRAVKRYFPQIAGERETKIRAMVGSRMSGSATTVAFPEEIVTDGRGKFVGFTMRFVDKHKEIHELQTPSSRQRHFPSADYRFLVRVALNVARVFAQVHSTGCVVGDINQRGILVSQTATVALIDADSFQFIHKGQRHLCVVGVPEYTPPELQGKSLKDIVRTKDHDAFGLAVCIFQILCMDRHPFSGRSKAGDMPLEKAISEFRFVYSGRNTGMEPPPGSVKLSDFPTSIKMNFEEAFAPDHVGKRPNPEMWVKSLQDMEQSLKACSRNKLHHYSQSAQECPWCRMEATYGRPLFSNPNVDAVIIGNAKVQDGKGWVIDVAALLSAINSVPIPSSISIALPPIDQSLRPSEASKAQINEQRKKPLVTLAGIGIAALGGWTLINVPGLSLIALGICGYGLYLAFSGYSSFKAEGALVQQHKTTWLKIRSAVQAIQAQAPMDTMHRTKAEAISAIDQHKILSKAFEQLRVDYDGHRRQSQLESYLAGFPLRRAKIDKLRTSDFAALASYNFQTALDVKTRDVQQVQGIGPVKDANLKAWVRSLEARFQYNPVYTAEDQTKIRGKQADIIAKQRAQDEKIKSLLAKLQSDARALEAWRTRIHPELVILFQELSQLECDIKAAGVTVPTKDTIPPYQATTYHAYSSQGIPTWGSGTTGVRPTTGNSTACPNCGSSMRLRTARRGQRSGSKFWGCSRYPVCHGTRPY